MENRHQKFRRMLNSPVTDFIMEAHNGISAKLVEQAGFSGIWASGFSISSSLGVRDRNEITWTQVLDVVEYMSDATNIPILLDADTGYGDYNNFSRVVRKLCERNISGACIEDKVFPKRNSFIGEKQELTPIEEFTGKIKAGIDNKLFEEFSIIARTEALIAGHGVDEALRRATAYYEAGADAVLIHSKMSNAEEVLEFCQRFQAPCPVVIVPTKYYMTPTEVFEQAGISLVIWANHSLRTSVKAMKNTMDIIYREKSLVNVEKKITTMSEIFEMTGEFEMKALEQKYLNQKKCTNIVYLAATRGKYLDGLTHNIPKCLIEIDDRPLFESILDGAKSQGISNISVVTGYQNEKFADFNVNKILNPLFQSSGEVYSLISAIDEVKEDTIIAYADRVVSDYIISQLISDKKSNITIVVDKNINVTDSNDERLVTCDAPFSDNPLRNKSVYLRSISSKSLKFESKIHGLWIGMMKVNGKGHKLFREGVRVLTQAGKEKSADLSDLLNVIVNQGHVVNVMYVSGDWTSVNNLVNRKQTSNESEKLPCIDSILEKID